MEEKGNYAFVDGQNLYESLVRRGWKLRYDKLREYLRREYNVKVAVMYLGSVSNDVYRGAIRAGFIVKTKRAVPYRTGTGEVVLKTNVDADLIVGVLGKYAGEYRKAVVISGDVDFLPLYEYLIEQDMLACIMVPNRRMATTKLEEEPFYDYTTYMTDPEMKADLLGVITILCC